MEPLRIIIISFGGIFTFAFGLAWFLPLVVAGKEERQRGKTDAVFSLLDLVLLLMDAIPVFWLFRSIPEAPSTFRAMRETWKKEPSVRVMFRLSAVSLLVTLAACFFPEW